MREKLNENPLVQAAVIGVLALVVVFLFITRMGGGGNETPPAPTDTSATAPTDAAATGSAEVTAPPGVEFDAPTAEQEATAQALLGGVPPGSFVAGPGLPIPLVKAYADGKVVVLLITREKGIDDRELKAEVEKLRGRGDVALFETNAKGISRYSRITNGVDVDRTPALVVMKPRRLSEGVPVATVSYGFRGPGSIQQAVRDALYEGKSNLPYYPK